LANQLGKNKTWQNSLLHVEIYACRIGLTSTFLPHAKSGGRVKKEINNREGFLMQVFKRWKDINIILFLS
jgi:hypothetical protein